MEIYKKIDNYQNYSVSTLGNVRNDKTKRILKQSIDTKGYYIVQLSSDGKRLNQRVHRLVASAFIPNPEDKECVDHIDNNPSNNHVSNLRFATPTENSRNTSIGKHNKSGVKGVYLDSRSNTWRASITIDGISINIGSYKSIDEAKEARVKKANQVFGDYMNACEKK